MAHCIERWRTRVFSWGALFRGSLARHVRPPKRDPALHEMSAHMLADIGLNVDTLGHLRLYIHHERAQRYLR